MTLHKPDKVFSTVADSTLFDHLDSTWEFHKGPTPTTTWLTFGVDFAFKSPLYKHVATVFFDEVSQSCTRVPNLSPALTADISSCSSANVLLNIWAPS